MNIAAHLGTDGFIDGDGEIFDIIMSTHPTSTLELEINVYFAGNGNPLKFTLVLLNSSDMSNPLYAPDKTYLSFPLTTTPSCTCTGVTITSDYTATSLDFTLDLLSGNAYPITFPALTVAPACCTYTTAWTLEWVSDNSVVSGVVTSTEITLQYDPADFGVRHAMYAKSGAFNLKVTITGEGQTRTRDFAVEITMEDACRSSTIEAQTITLPDYIVTTTSLDPYPAFTDS